MSEILPFYRKDTADSLTAAHAALAAFIKASELVDWDIQSLLSPAFTALEVEVNKLDVERQQKLLQQADKKTARGILLLHAMVEIDARELPDIGSLLTG